LVLDSPKLKVSKKPKHKKVRRGSKVKRRKGLKKGKKNHGVGEGVTIGGYGRKSLTGEKTSTTQKHIQG